MNNNQPKHIAEIMQQFFKEHNWGQRIEGYNLLDCWVDILPPKIALNTKPIKIQNDTLFLMVKNNIWAQEITLRKGEIINTINKKIGKILITNIVIKINFKQFINEK
jgi:predicted nucleic acid-binding Zn ribbon protein